MNKPVVLPQIKQGQNKVPPVTGEIQVGDRLLWEPDDTRYREEVLVVDRRTSGGRIWLELDGRAGRCWDLESRIRQHCVRAESSGKSRRSWQVC